MRSASLFVLVILNSIALMSTSCVTRATYDDLKVDRDTLAKRQVELLEEMEVLNLANQGLAENLAVSTTENVAMRATYDQLVVELETEVASGQIEIQQLIDGIQLNVSDKLLFASGSAALNSAGIEVIRRVAARIKDEPAVVDVEGHTDSTQIGPSLRKMYPTNWELAGARAASVVRQLSQDGVPPGRLRAVSRGPFDPVAPNDTPDGRARNRRTEIVLRLMPE
ncbi:OmpA family protein [Myxococcota bacterium]|nr:OmpA family protein [Myxococcota bacterium]